MNSLVMIPLLPSLPMATLIMSCRAVLGPISCTSKPWGNPSPVVSAMAKEGTISEKDLELYRIIDEPQAVVEAIFKYYEHRGFEPSEEEAEKMLHL